MDTHYSFHVARRRFGALCDRVENGSIAVIHRSGSRSIALVDAAERQDLLATHFPFVVHVRVDANRVAIWTDQLPVHAQAEDLDSAAHALAVELIEYAIAWVNELRFAPNHQDSWGFVRRIELAGSEQAVEAMLLADAGFESNATSAG